MVKEGFRFYFTLRGSFRGYFASLIVKITTSSGWLYLGRLGGDKPPIGVAKLPPHEVFCYFVPPFLFYLMIGCVVGLHYFLIDWLR